MADQSHVASAGRASRSVLHFIGTAKHGLNAPYHSLLGEQPWADLSTQQCPWYCAKLMGRNGVESVMSATGGRLGEDQVLKRLRWLQRGRRWLLCCGTGSLISIIAVHALQLLGIEHHLQSSLNVVMRALPYVSRKFLS